MKSYHLQHRGYYAKGYKSDKDKHIQFHLYMGSKKNKTRQINQTK